MQKRTMALAAGGGVVAVVAVVALVMGLRLPSKGGSEPESAPPAAAGPGRAAPSSPAANRPAAAQVPAAPPDLIPDLRARDQRRRDAVAPFGASLLAGLDTCVGAGPGPRVPQRLLLRFQRAAAAAPGQEAFELKSVAPVDARPGSPALHTTPLGACLSGLAGRTLLIPAGPGTQESSFEEIVALPIPASVAWAPPQIPIQ